MTTLSQLGQMLLSERTHRKLPKTALAQRSGVHRNTLHQLENGTGNVELNTLIAICDALDLSIRLVPNDVADSVTPIGGVRQSALAKMLDERLGSKPAKDAK